tara:strand:- start:845 stop:1009 length:165 start_codon:yes stop_codon:yes gene_type:complete
MTQITEVEAEEMFHAGLEIWVYSGEYDEDMNALRFPFSIDYGDEFITDKEDYFI